MGATHELERVLLKVDGSSTDLSCSVLEESQGLITVQFSKGSAGAEFAEGASVALIRSRYSQTKACTGTLESVDGERIVIKFEVKVSQALHQDDSNLTDCQLPAMFRPRSPEGFYGCWRGAFIVKHGPDRLYIQIEEDQSIPRHMELMFSPIGSDSGAGSGRMYGDDGSVINASDVRSRRIRVRAITRDVLPSDSPGTVTLVMDITRTLYRTA